MTSAPAPVPAGGYATPMPMGMPYYGMPAAPAPAAAPVAATPAPAVGNPFDLLMLMMGGRPQAAPAAPAR